MNLRSILNENEAEKAGAHGRLGEHVHVEQSKGNAGGADCEGHLSPFLSKGPETADVHESPQDDGRGDGRTKTSQ